MSLLEKRNRAATHNSRCQARGLSTSVRAELLQAAASCHTFHSARDTLIVRPKQPDVDKQSGLVNAV